MNKIKKDGLAVIIAGKDKDKQGRVVFADTKKNKVLVQGYSMVTKHTEQVLGKPQDGIVNREASIDIPNVMLVVNGKTTRIGSGEKNGKKIRVAKITGKIID